MRIRIGFLLISFLLITIGVSATEYYVVIGSFARESNARTYTGTIRQLFREATYSFHEDTRLYYVHVLRTKRNEEARNWSLYLRHDKAFDTHLEAAAI